MIMDSTQSEQLKLVDLFAHDLKQPLGGIRNCAQMVEQTGELNPQQRKWLDRVYRNVDRMVGLINDMLSASELEHVNRLEKTLQPLPPLIESVVELLESLIEERGIELIVNIAPDAQMILVNPFWFRHALLNVVSNAIKYNRELGMLRITARTEPGYTCIDVQDSGVGIPPEALERIFDKFYRAKTAKGTDGFGLGLSIVKSVIERHDGRVSVRSVMGQGTTFEIRVPLAPDSGPRLNEPGELLDAIDDDSQEAQDSVSHESRDDQR